MRLNEVIEEQNFANEIEELKAENPRIYEIKDAIIWDLARNPKLGTSLLRHPDYMVYETSPLDSEALKFWILYKWEPENEKVRLFSLELIPSEEE